MMIDSTENIPRPNMCVGGVKRYEWIDSIKGIFICLVVFGHMLRGETAFNNSIYGWIHYFIYSVHMPIFIFISGIFSKNYCKIDKLIRTFVIPYFLVNIVAWIIELIMGKFELRRLITPWEITWYICTLFFYRTKIWQKNKTKLLFISLVLSLFMPWMSKKVWYIMSVGRTFMLYPVFYMGQFWDIAKLNKIRHKKYIIRMVFPVTLFIEVLLVKTSIVNIRWATHDYPLNHTELCIKYVFFVFAVVTFFWFSILDISRFKFLISWGRNSMCVYLFHMFILEGIKLFIPIFNIYMFPFLISGTVIITALLSSEYVKKHFEKAVDLIYIYGLNKVM